MTLPDGDAADEVPDPIKLDLGFASYQREVKADKHELQYSRELVIKQLDLAPGDYDGLRKLEAAMTTDEHRSAVLRKE